MLSRLYDKASNIDQLRINRAVVAAIVLLALLLIGWQLWAAVTTAGYQPTVAPPLPASHSSNPINYKITSITRSHLFGQLEGQSATEQNIPITSLQLKLRGAFTSTNPKLASAIIEGPDGQTRSYKVEQRLYRQATLQEVYADRVVLSRNGQLETLYFPSPATTSSTSQSASISQQAAAAGYDIPDDIQSLVQENMSTTEIQQAARELTSSAMTPEQRQALIRKRLQDLRNRANRKK